jgi:hypothetical protein
MRTIPGISKEAEEGISQAREYFRLLALDGAAETQVNESRGDIFLDVTIEGIRFQAFADTDPYVTRKDRSDWCQLGVASIHLAKGLGAENRAAKWMVCKYSASEGRIDLSDLSDAGRRAFSITFGVPIGMSYGFDEGYAFYASCAIDGLVAWAKRRPRKFKAERGISSYIGDWKAIVDVCINEVEE